MMDGCRVLAQLYLPFPTCLLVPSLHRLLSSDQMCLVNLVKNNKMLAARSVTRGPAIANGIAEKHHQTAKYSCLMSKK